MNQTELAKTLGVSKAYISMVMSGKKKASKRMMSILEELKVNQPEANNEFLSLACLPIPALPLNETNRYFTILDSILLETFSHNLKYIRYIM